MKKIFLLIVAMVATAALAGCGDKSGAKDNGIADSLELLNTVWGSWPEDMTFPVSGGDSGQMVMNAPGKFSVENGEALDASLAFPAAETGKIDDAASLVHMMNANTFTAGAFRLKDAGDGRKAAEAVKANLDSRQWICGFPEEYLIASVDNYLVCVFGTADLVDTFRNQMESAYENVSVLYEGPVSVR